MQLDHIPVLLRKKLVRTNKGNSGKYHWRVEEVSGSTVTHNLSNADLNRALDKRCPSFLKSRKMCPEWFSWHMDENYTSRFNTAFENFATRFKIFKIIKLSSTHVWNGCIILRIFLTSHMSPTGFSQKWISGLILMRFALMNCHIFSYYCS
jgi:hypothetical protein